MDKQTLITNLERTIAGKEAMLKGVDRNNVYGSITAQWLDINIDELKRILADVRQLP